MGLVVATGEVIGEDVVSTLAAHLIADGVQT